MIPSMLQHKPSQKINLILRKPQSSAFFLRPKPDLIFHTLFGPGAIIQDRARRCGKKRARPPQNGVFNF